ncbi:radical SAM protein [Rhodomicrobium sp. Az07]|uniref:radical SAM protein n=1 Tax=Rhodomicrobium sp. Az07 TaxID=2839034 RepID=UPI001BEC2633|nr:radical SAM protein [Rhodomicrobium sp. Az07]MBT3070512.1 radical SAM protein [Rhodomicrobium sp. Az07]
MHQAAPASNSRQSSAAEKFADPVWTANGERRASVSLTRLDTVWFNTGTLCNIACEHCYIESSPKNDRLAWLTLADALPFLDEMARLPRPVSLVGFTGGEPFMNADFVAILEETLARGFETLTLTNALKPLEHSKADIARLAAAHGARLRIRVSLDDFREGTHDRERGGGAFALALDGLEWLWRAGVRIEIAARSLQSDSEHAIRSGFAALFATRGILLDCDDRQALVLLPEMRPDVSPPEITEACWGILRKTPDDAMCSNARMVVKRKGAARPAVVACTLLPYDERFELGATLDAAAGAVPLVHPWCATFCVLGGGSCGSMRAAG